MTDNAVIKHLNQQIAEVRDRRMVHREELLKCNRTLEYLEETLARESGTYWEPKPPTSGPKIVKQVLLGADEPMHIKVIYEEAKELGAPQSSINSMRATLDQYITRGKLFKKYPEHGPAFYGLLEWGERFETVNFINSKDGSEPGQA